VNVFIYSSTGASVASAQTDVAGHYVVSVNLASGTYFARTSNMLGYIDQIYRALSCTTCAVTTGTPIPVSAGLETGGIDFALTQGTAITGRVVDAATLSPLPGVSVLIYNSSGSTLTAARTDSTGAYTSAALPAGTYFAATSNTLGYIDELYRHISCTGCSVITGTPIVASGAGAVTGVDFTLTAAARIGGQVTSESTGAALSSVLVRVFNTAGRFVTSGTTNSAGRYVTNAGLPDGTYFVRTQNAADHVDELYDGIRCLPNCTVTNGTPVAIVSGVPRTDVDFALALAGFISGTVSDAGTGLPLAGVAVSLYDAGGTSLGSTSTDSAGRFRSFPLPAGRYFARTSNTLGYSDILYRGISCTSCPVTGGTPIDVASGGTASNVDFALVLGGRVSGQVVDEVTGAPIAGISVSIYNATGSFVVAPLSDATGHFTSAPIAPGTYFARTSNSQGYIDELFAGRPCAPCSVTTGDPITVTSGAATPGVDFAITRGGRISGRLTDAISGAPLNNVSVSIYTSTGSQLTTGRTGADGVYTSNAGLPSGTYFVRTANTLGYVDGLYAGLPCVACSVFAGTPIAVTAPATASGIDFALAMGGRIAGRITDSVSAAPLAGATVRIYTSTGAATSAFSADSSGAYLSPFTLPSGTYFVRASAAGHTDKVYQDLACVTCVVTSGTPVVVAAPATTASIDLALSPGSRISGRVTAADTGASLPGVSVTIYLATGLVATSALTDSQGRYVTPSVLSAGTYFARTSNSAGYVSELFDDRTCSACDLTRGTPILVPDNGEAAGIDFVLERGGQISGRVTDATTGAPVATGIVILETNGNMIDNVFTNASGIYTTRALPPAEYFVLTYNASGYLDEMYDDVLCPNCNGQLCDTCAEQASRVAVSVDTTVNGIDFALAPGGRISGRLTDGATGRPLGGRVRFYNSAGRFVSSTLVSSSSTGMYTSEEGLPAGTYFVLASATGYVPLLYDNRPCAGLSCDVTQGTGVAVTLAHTTAAVDFAFHVGGRIEGRVTDDAGRPLAGIRVDVTTTSLTFAGNAVTDAAGHYSVGGGALPAGNYFARTVNARGYVNVVYQSTACCDVTAGTPIAVADGATTADIDFVLTAGGTVEGTVTDATTGAALASVGVSIFDATGRFVAAGLSTTSGAYAGDGGLPTGTYFALTSTTRGYLNEIYDDIPCFTCATARGRSTLALTGTPIAVAAGSNTAHIDFGLAACSGTAVAQPAQHTTAEDTSLNVTLTSATTGRLAFSVASPPAQGTLSGTAPNLVYTPRADFNGADAFTFTVTNGCTTSAPATISINVTPVNDPPVVAHPIGTVTVSQSAPDTILDLGAVFADVDVATNGDTLSYAVVANDNPALVLGGVLGRTLTLRYAFGQSGSAHLTVRATDGAGLAVDDTITLVVIERTPPTIALVRPHGGRAFTGTPYVIEWTASDNVGLGSFDVFVSSDGGVTFSTIAECAALAAAARQCVWMSPGPVTTTARVRVRATDLAGNMASDTSSANVTIVSGAASLAVTAPNTAVSWRIDDRRNITWTHNLGKGETVSIELSRDGGSTWENLGTTTTSAATTGTFAWTVTGAVTAQARVRVSWAANPSVRDTSDVSFSILDRITVTAPNAANVHWAIGQPQVITWNHNLGAAQAVDIDVSRDAGLTWERIGAGVVNATATTGRFDWVATGPVTGQARVRVSWASAPSVNDTNDVDFTIADPFLTVTAPVTAVSWRIGDVRAISWIHNLGVGQPFGVELSRDGGLTWESLGTTTSTTATGGALAWTVTGPITAQARARVTWIGNPAVRDGSGVDFNILDRLTVTAPNTAVNWAVGTTRKITWTHNLPASDRVDVELSRDGGIGWETLAAGVANSATTSGSFDWVVTGPPTDLGRVRVRSTTFPLATDASDTSFTIADPFVTVTAPNAGVAWRVGDSRSITWSHNLGAGELMEVELSRDGGVTWEALGAASTTSATTGTFSWTVTGPLTTQARVRVRRASDPSVADVGDVNFRILDRITVSAPNTAVTWTLGTTQTITWAHNLGTGAPMNVELSRNGGATWETLASGIANTAATTGSFVWGVTGPATGLARVRVSWAASPAVSDVSDVTFTLR
jgi:5-hydroxyisourate hydrolase-like protein (transthyretin family)